MNTSSASTMAAYNRWMNGKLYAICAELGDAERKTDRGAFFGSIHGTLNHLLLADRIWMSRFTGADFSFEGLDQQLFADFDELRAERARFDDVIVSWAAELTDDALQGMLSFRTAANPTDRSMPLWVCVTHFFNHQTHHRGQLTTLLSQAGKEVGVTDLLWMPGAGEAAPDPTAD